MTQLENYTRIAEAFDALTIRAEQLRALSRVIEDVNAAPDKDIRSIQSANWLLSTLMGEHSTALTALQKQFLEKYKP